jgi:hypothetical protein
LCGAGSVDVGKGQARGVSGAAPEHEVH